jgi:phytoene dehydrogenase-like protein
MTNQQRSYDAIVIGGGHNGLINGAYLAKAGLRTLILERRDILGGAAITEELHPGFQFTTFSYALSQFRPQVVQELQLVKYGFMPLLMESQLTPMENGDYLLLGQDEQQNISEIRRHSRHDADAFEQFSYDVARVVEAVRPVLDSIPPDITSNDPEELMRMAELAQHVRSLPPRVIHNGMRLLTGSISDFLDDYFESEILKASIAAAGIIGSKVGPKSQGSGLVMLYMSIGEHDGDQGAWAFHKGGNGGLMQVLARAAEGHGAEIATGTSVSHVITNNGIATGVALDDGRELDAKVVVSSLDARRTFLQLVEPSELPAELVDSVNRMRFQGTSAKVNFALDGLPHFPALSDRGEEPFRGFVNVGPSVDYLERAFDDAKYGWFSQHPYLDACVQSTIDRDMAPPGKHVMSNFVQYAPYELKGSNWDAERENLGDTVQAALERFFPGFGELVLHREVVTPLDIERTTGLTEGNIYGGEFLAPQMFFFRPAPGWNQYRTPISGYYQCGSGTHPGGCVMGAPARLAASQIVGDQKQKS